MLLVLGLVSVFALRHVAVGLGRQDPTLESLAIAAAVVAASVTFVGAVALLAVRWPRAALVVALTAVIAIRLGASLLYTAAQATDWAQYMHLATGLLNGAPPFADRAMGWPILLAATWRVFGESVQSGVLLNVLLSGITGLLLTAWVRGFAGPRAAAIAVAIYAVLAGQVAWSLLLATEVPYTLAILAIAIALRRLMHAWVRLHGARLAIWSAGFGLLLGLSYWLRTTSLVLVPLLVLVPWIAGAVGEGSPSRRKAALTSIALVIGVVVTLAPVVAWNRVELSRWSVSNSLFSGWQLFVGNNPRFGGTWNQADRSVADRLLGASHPDFVPDQFADGSLSRDSRLRMAAVDDRLLDQGLHRLADHGLSWPVFLLGKLDRGWAGAAAGIDFASAPGGSQRVTQDEQIGLAMAADVQWVLVLLGALLWYWRRRSDPGLDGTIVAAITLAILVGILLLEAQPRYHEYVVPLFAGLAAVELARLARLREGPLPPDRQESGTPIRS